MDREVNSNSNSNFQRNGEDFGENTDMLGDGRIEHKCKASSLQNGDGGQSKTFGNDCDLHLDLGEEDQFALGVWSLRRP